MKRGAGIDSLCLARHGQDPRATSAAAKVEDVASTEADEVIEAEEGEAEGISSR